MKLYKHELQMAAVIGCIIGLGTFAVFGLFIVKADVEKTCEQKGGVLVDTSRGSIYLIVERAKP